MIKNEKLKSFDDAINWFWKERTTKNLEPENLKTRLVIKQKLSLEETNGPYQKSKLDKLRFFHKTLGSGSKVQYRGLRLEQKSFQE